MVLAINDCKDRLPFTLPMVENINQFPGAKFLGCLPYAEKISSATLKSPQPLWIWQKEEISDKISVTMPQFLDESSLVSECPIDLEVLARQLQSASSLAPPASSFTREVSRRSITPQKLTSKKLTSKKETSKIRISSNIEEWENALVKSQDPEFRRKYIEGDL